MTGSWMGPTAYRLVCAIGLAYLPLIGSRTEEQWLWAAALLAPVAGALAWRGSLPSFWGLWPGWLVLLAWGEAWMWAAWLLPTGSHSVHFVGALGGLLGLVALGWGLALLGAALVRWDAAGAGLWVAALTLLFAGAPVGYWLSGPAPWGPEATATLLSLCPHGLVLEAAGVDFMRMPGIYDSAGADRIGPDLRIAWGTLAGWGSLVLGCWFVAAGQVLLRRFPPTP